MIPTSSRARTSLLPTLAWTAAATLALVGAPLAPAGAATLPTVHSASAVTRATVKLAGNARLTTSHGLPTTTSGREVGLMGKGSTAYRRVSIGTTGRVALFARGQACGANPVVSVAVDHHTIGRTTLAAGRSYRTYLVGPSVRSGNRLVSVRLVNDRYRSRKCDINAFIGGFGLSAAKPSATSTGAPAAARLRKVRAGSVVHATNGTAFRVDRTGKLTINRSGVTISGYDLTGIVSVPASHVTVTNSVIRGMDLGSVTSGWSNTRLYSSSGAGNTISYTTVRPDAHLRANGRVGVDGRWIGMGGGGFTADHVDDSKAIDLMQTTSDNVTLTNSWLHANTQYAAGKDAWLVHAFPQFAKNPSHSDAWQAEGGSNITIRGNNFDGSTPWTAFIVTQNVGKTNNVTIAGNWLGGGSCTINLADNKNRGYSSRVSITRNVFTGVARGSSLRGCHIISKYQTKTSDRPTYRGLSVSGNRSTDGYDANRIKRG